MKWKKTYVSKALVVGLPVLGESAGHGDEERLQVLRVLDHILGGDEPSQAARQKTARLAALHCVQRVFHLCVADAEDIWCESAALALRGEVHACEHGHSQVNRRASRNVASHESSISSPSCPRRYRGTIAPLLCPRGGRRRRLRLIILR